MAKRKNKKEEQQEIKGARSVDKSIEKSATEYAEALESRMEWQAEENNLRVEFMDAMDEAGRTEYYLKDGTLLEVVSKGDRVKKSSPKDDESKDARQTGLKAVE